MKFLEKNAMVILLVVGAAILFYWFTMRSKPSESIDTSTSGCMTKQEWDQKVYNESKAIHATPWRLQLAKDEARLYQGSDTFEQYVKRRAAWALEHNEGLCNPYKI